MSNLYLPHASKQQGFSLVELMVSMVLGLVITGGVISVFTSVQANYQITQGISVIQENNHYLRHFMVDAVSNIGQTHGCAADIPHGNNVKVGSNDYDIALAGSIKGYEISGGSNNATSASLPNTITANGLAPGSDLIEIQTLTDIGNVTIANDLTGASTTANLLVTNANDKLTSKSIYTYIAPNCSEAVSFYTPLVVENANGTFLGHEKAVSTDLVQRFSNCVLEAVPPYVCSTSGGDDTSYDAPAGAKVFKTEHYVLALKQDSDEQSGIYSLYRIDLHGENAANESLLLTGITDFQMLYGVMDPASSGTRRVQQYVTAANVTDWNEVGAIKVLASLSATSDAIGADEIAVREIEQVITIRNRMYN